MLTSLDEHQLLVFWTQLLVLITAARLFGWVLRRIGQPSIVGELLAGLVLGPSVFGKFWEGGFDWFLPHDEVQSGMILAVGWLGVFLLLVVTGFETDLTLIRKLGRAAALVATFSLVVPFAAALVVGFLLPDSFVGGDTPRFVFALFVAAALCVSSLAVIAKILSELGLMRRDFGQITVAAGMANDVVGWVVLGVIAGLAASGSVSVIGVLGTLAGIAAFAGFAMTLGQRVVDFMLRMARRRGEDLPAALTVSLLVTLAFGVVTQYLGVEAVLGAFVAGIVLGRSRFQQEGVIRFIEAMTLSLFAPLFFATAGLRVDLASLGSSEGIRWTLVVLAVGIVAKFLGAFYGARRAKLSTREGLALGAGLNARGALEIVIATVGLQLEVFNETAYTAIVLVPIVSSLLAGAGLRAVVHNWRGTLEEQERLEREEALARNLVVNSKRILLPSRGGPNSIAAAQIVHAAWPAEAAVTIASVATPSGRLSEKGISVVQDVLPDREVERKAVRNDDRVAALVKEARLGYGVLCVGATDSRQVGRLLSPLVDDLLRVAPVPLVIVRRGRNVMTELLPAFAKAVVPVSGGRSSRAAQEVAFNLGEQVGPARIGPQIVLTHVLDRPESSGRTDPPTLPVDLPSTLPALWAAERGLVAATPLDDLAERMIQQALGLAKELGANASAEVRSGSSAAVEIIDLVQEEEADLVVVGATLSRFDDRPFLGHTVEHLLEECDATVVVVVAEPPADGE